MLIECSAPLLGGQGGEDYPLHKEGDVSSPDFIESYRYQSPPIGGGKGGKLNRNNKPPSAAVGGERSEPPYMGEPRGEPK